MVRYRLSFDHTNIFLQSCLLLPTRKIPQMCHKNPEIFHSLAKHSHQHLQQGHLCQKKQETVLERSIFIPSPPFLPPLILLLLPLVNLVNLLPPIICVFSVQLISFSVIFFLALFSSCITPYWLIGGYISTWFLFFRIRRSVK